MTQDILVCGHCFRSLGTLGYIIEKDLTVKHKCFLNFDNITVDIETKKVCGQKKHIVDGKTNNSSAGCSGSGSRILPTVISESTISDEEDTSVTTVSDSTTGRLSNPPNDENGEHWTEAKIKLLIQSYIIHKEKFSSPIYTKKKVWDKISSDLQKYGVEKSGKKCDEKWRNIKKTYEKVLSEKNKTGSAPVTWTFFNDLHDIYAKDPIFSPIATSSSSGKFQVQDKTDETVAEKNLSPGEKPRIRAISALEIDQRKQKRHEEKMALKREMFQWFQENYKKRKHDEEK